MAQKSMNVILEIPPATNVPQFCGVISNLITVYQVKGDLPLQQDVMGNFDHPIPESRQLLTDQILQLKHDLNYMKNMGSEIVLVGAKQTPNSIILHFTYDETDHHVCLS